MSDPLKFDAYQTDFKTGITLVEASAGTGKTFTIAMLVLRAIVELGLLIEQVLVVTFTISATDELRNRVRQRLSQARHYLKNPGEREENPEDREFHRWLKSIKNPAEAHRRLDLALLDIDRAAIHTIHGFSQKTLHDLALESGQLYDLELTGDKSLVRSQVVQDFWRKHLYEMDKRYCSLIISSFDSPEKLYRSIAGAEDILSRLVPEPFDFNCIRDVFDREREGLFAWWERDGGTITTLALDAVSNGYITAKYKQLVSTSLKRIDSCFIQGHSPVQADLGWLHQDVLIGMLHGNKLRGADKKAQFLADWPLPGNRLASYLAAVEDLLLSVRLECAAALRTDLTRRMREQGTLSFDDLIISLAHAVSGPSGSDLCRQVRRRYKIGLIDEFQDTDSAQWQIFSTLFTARDHYLYLIGDPKQAIYRFRGADIYSYFSARDTADRLFTLEYNYRSHPGLVSAVNSLFETFSLGGVCYQAVQPARSSGDGRLLKDGKEISGLVYCQLDKKEDDKPAWNSTDSGEVIRHWIVSEVIQLVAGRMPVEHELTDTEGVLHRHRLVPADIAILVRSHREAEAYQASFRQVGIPAVITSKTGVFTTAECESLLLVLQAIAAPGNERLLKTAMSCDWFGLSGDEHFRICNDVEAFNSWQERFQEYADVWRQAGFLPMMRRFLETERVEIVLGRKIGAERRISNIHHLGELIQEAERKGHLKMSSTLLWLQEMTNEKPKQDEVELRLESDADSLRVITMHSSKGLEFPVVFCPSLLTPSYKRDDNPLVQSHLDDGTRICDLGSKHFDRNRERSLLEEEQENMRLAYVAVTRAQLCCYIFWADIKAYQVRPASFKASLGRLLFPAGPVGFEEQKKEIESRCSHQYCDYRLIANQVIETAYQAKKGSNDVVLAPRKSSGRTLTTHRTRTSFSGLAMLASRDDQDQLPGAFDEAQASAVIVSDAGAERQILSGSRLPGGVRFGNIVHGALEQMNFSDIAEGTCDREELAVLGRRYNLSVDSEELERLLRTTVTVGLLADSTDSFALADLDDNRLIKEMEFTLHLEQSSTRVLNELLADDPCVSSLSVRSIEGYLTGYIDLVCEINNKYFVIDYKTNHLGHTTAAYERFSLQRAMFSHNYGLQYWLYTLVVHRHLKRWLPSYCYGDNFGGVLYLFVRGMQPEHPGNSVFFTKPAEGLVYELDKRFGAK